MYIYEHQKGEGGKKYTIRYIKLRRFVRYYLH